MQTNPSRIQFIDLLRGLAVVVMIMGHSVDAVLSNDARTTDWYRVYEVMRGFTAPVFLFVSGMAFMAASAGKWDQYRMPGKPLTRRIRRFLLLIGIGYALHFPFFSLHRILADASPGQLALLFQADVLHCVGAGLLILQGMLILSPGPERFTRFALPAGVLLVLASPLVWRVDFSGLVSPMLSPYLNQQQTSIFPLFPFAGFMFLGAAAGELYLRARREGREARFVRAMLLAGPVLAAAGAAAELLPFRLYPEPGFWKASPNLFLMRLGVVLVVIPLVHSLGRIPEGVRRMGVMLGQASLTVYVVHLVVAYGSPLNSGLAQVVGRSLGPGGAFLTGLCMLAAMAVFVRIRNYATEHHAGAIRIAGLAVAGTLAAVFLTVSP
ncbi:MAG: heparan-alpha-glucosaminide N-acetyltransferase domain-containing protein [Bacteroidota bacterium]